MILNGLLSFIQFEKADVMGEDDWWQGYAWAVGLGVAMAIKAVTENIYFYLVVRSGWKLRSSVTTAVYRKSLRLTAAARQRKTVGEIVNLMQLDSTKMEAFMSQVVRWWGVVWWGYFALVHPLHCWCGMIMFVGNLSASTCMLLSIFRER